MCFINTSRHPGTAHHGVFHGRGGIGISRDSARMPIEAVSDSTAVLLASEKVTWQARAVLSTGYPGFSRVSPPTLSGT
jgi:hypothetical protein